MAEVSASVIGLFVVGVFVNVEAGRRRSGEARPQPAAEIVADLCSQLS